MLCKCKCILYIYVHTYVMHMYTWPLRPATQYLGNTGTVQPGSQRPVDEVDKSLCVTGNTTSQGRSHGTTVPFTAAHRHNNGFLLLRLYQDVRAHLSLLQLSVYKLKTATFRTMQYMQFEVMRVCRGLGGSVSYLTFTADASTYSICQYHSSSFCIAAHVLHSYTPMCMTYLE